MLKTVPIVIGILIVLGLGFAIWNVTGPPQSQTKVVRASSPPAAPCLIHQLPVFVGIWGVSGNVYNSDIHNVAYLDVNGNISYTGDSTGAIIFTPGTNYNCEPLKVVQP